MSIPPESIAVGKCYLTLSGEARRVVVCEHGKVTFHTGQRMRMPGLLPRRQVMTLTTFAQQALREVPCDWMPQGDG
jgi:hypothetical protein